MYINDKKEGLFESLILGVVPVSLFKEKDEIPEEVLIGPAVQGISYQEKGFPELELVVAKIRDEVVSGVKHSKITKGFQRDITNLFAKRFGLVIRLNHSSNIGTFMSVFPANKKINKFFFTDMNVDIETLKDSAAELNHLLKADFSIDEKNALISGHKDGYVLYIDYEKLFNDDTFSVPQITSLILAKVGEVFSYVSTLKMYSNMNSAYNNIYDNNIITQETKEVGDNEAEDMAKIEESLNKRLTIAMKENSIPATTLKGNGIENAKANVINTIDFLDTTESMVNSGVKFTTNLGYGYDYSQAKGIIAASSISDTDIPWCDLLLAFLKIQMVESLVVLAGGYLLILAPFFVLYYPLYLAFKVWWLYTRITFVSRVSYYLANYVLVSITGADYASSIKIIKTELVKRLIEVDDKELKENVMMMIQQLELNYKNHKTIIDKQRTFLSKFLHEEDPYSEHTTFDLLDNLASNDLFITQTALESDK